MSETVSKAVGDVEVNSPAEPATEAKGTSDVEAKDTDLLNSSKSTCEVSSTGQFVWLQDLMQFMRINLTPDDINNLMRTCATMAWTMNV